VIFDLMSSRYRLDVEDNLAARRTQTQILMLHRIVVALVAIVTLSIMLMTFPAIKHIGISLLASAGLAGLVIGTAMKSTLANLIAGVQIAFTQPIRLEDAVVVEGEWGWRRNGTTYVVARIWDLGRLVAPLSFSTASEQMGLEAAPSSGQYSFKDYTFQLTSWKSSAASWAPRACGGWVCVKSRKQRQWNLLS
jgi:hypothetical protein